MKNHYLIALLATFTLSGCVKYHDHEDCDPESVNANFTHGKKITVETFPDRNSNNYKVEDGTNTVFKYVHSKAQCDNAVDDELETILTFEVAPEVTQFRFSGSEVKATNCYLNEAGAWAGGYYEIESGLIEGSKISEGTWRVKASVLTKPKFPEEKPKKIEFEEVFLL